MSYKSFVAMVVFLAVLVLPIHFLLEALERHWSFKRMNLLHAWKLFKS